MEFSLAELAASARQALMSRQDRERVRISSEQREKEEAYRRLFTSPDGVIVLNDLIRFCGVLDDQTSNEKRGVALRILHIIHETEESFSARHKAIQQQNEIATNYE